MDSPARQAGSPGGPREPERPAGTARVGGWRETSGPAGWSGGDKDISADGGRLGFSARFQKRVSGKIISKANSGKSSLQTHPPARARRDPASQVRSPGGPNRYLSTSAQNLQPTEARRAGPAGPAHHSVRLNGTDGQTDGSALYFHRGVVTRTTADTWESQLKPRERGTRVCFMTTDFLHLGLHKCQHSTVTSLCKGGHWAPRGAPSSHEGLMETVSGRQTRPQKGRSSRTLHLFSLSHRKENPDVVDVAVRQET